MKPGVPALMQLGALAVETGAGTGGPSHPGPYLFVLELAGTPLDDSREKSFTLELGVNLILRGTGQLILKGSGVGIVALRALPVPAGSTVRRLQAELYVERLEVVVP